MSNKIYVRLNDVIALIPNNVLNNLPIVVLTEMEEEKL